MWDPVRPSRYARGDLDAAIIALDECLARDAGLVEAEVDDSIAAETVIGRVETLLGAAGFPLTLEQHEFSLEEVPGLAAEAAEQWTANFNPRPVTEQDFEKLYGSLFAGSACEEVGNEASLS